MNFDFGAFLAQLKCSFQENFAKTRLKHAKCKYISIYDKSFAWVNKPKDGTFCFVEDPLIKTVVLLIDNCFFRLGDRIFRQIIGVPGTCWS